MNLLICIEIMAIIVIEILAWADRAPEGDEDGNGPADHMRER